MTRLFFNDQKPKTKWAGSVALVLRRPTCLSCGKPTTEIAFDQLPLFRSHGFGAVLRSVFRICDTCRKKRLVTITEASPLEGT